MVDRPRSFALTFVAYSALRLALFAVPLAGIYLLSGNPILSAVLAAAIGLGLSVALLGQQRSSVASRLREKVEARRRASDESVEDGVVDQSGSTSAAARPKP